MDILLSFLFALVACIALTVNCYNLGYYRRKRAREEKKRQWYRICRIFIFGVIGFASITVILFHYFPNLDGKNVYSDTSVFVIVLMIILFYILGFSKGSKKYSVKEKVSPLKTAPA